jgi:ribosomal protein S18 acetylase RimI-like enzyme
MASPPPTIIRCPDERRTAALAWLHDALPADLRSVFVEAIEQTNASPAASWDGLLIPSGEQSRSSQSSSVEAAIWIQPLAGNTAYLWCPPGESKAIDALLRSAADFLDRRRIPLAQMVVGAEDGYSAELLTRCGFPKFAELRYLYADARPPSSRASRAIAKTFPSLSFEPDAAEKPDFAALIEQTYVDSRDCPGLDGVRSMSDVLAGYRAQGRYSPNDWYAVQENNRNVGVLILAEHPDAGNWELVYFGLVPEARGRRLGQEVIRYALETVSATGGERLVAAVDSGNQPALDAYSCAGFFQWDRRIVYARLQPPS